MDCIEVDDRVGKLARRNAEQAISAFDGETCAAQPCATAGCSDKRSLLQPSNPRVLEHMLATRICCVDNCVAAFKIDDQRNVAARQLALAGRWSSAIQLPEFAH